MDVEQVSQHEMIFNTYDGLRVQIKPYKTIGLLLSGGLDSSVLLHLMNKANTSSKYYFFTMNKGDNSVGHVEELLTYHDMGNNTYEKVVINLDEYGSDDRYHGSEKESTGAWKSIYENYWDKIDVLYNGNTGMPTEDLESSTLPVDRTRSIKAEQKYTKFIMPFIHINKSHTVWLAKKYSLDNIIKYSHTCTEQADGSCGECWQCKERMWGFNYHGYEDVGIR